MPLPLLEGIKGFENGKFVDDLRCRFSSEICEEIAALFSLENNFENLASLLDRVGVVG